jgi:glycosyltransferase involved in cell wall biosynthesis
MPSRANSAKTAEKTRVFSAIAIRSQCQDFSPDPGIPSFIVIDSPRQHRISVALCTYNGGAFLPEQLASLAAQTLPPHEIVVFDDGSDDQTLDLLNRFRDSNPSLGMRLEVNPHRLGPAGNFERAIAACRGEIIALCDQDDVWMPDKLAVIAREFERNPKLGLVFSDADICDEAGNPLGYRLWQSVGFGGRLRRRAERGGAFDVILRQNVVTGATVAFSAGLRDLVLPIDPRWMHDGWIAILIAAVAPVSAIRTPLVRYRQHPGQSIGALRRTLYQQYLNAKKLDGQWFTMQAALYEAAMARLSGLDGGKYIVPPRTLRKVREKVCHWRRRSAIRDRKIARLLPSTAEFLTFRYRRFSLGWKSFAQDLFL